MIYIVFNIINIVITDTAVWTSYDFFGGKICTSRVTVWRVDQYCSTF